MINNTYLGYLIQELYMHPKIHANAMHIIHLNFIKTNKQQLKKPLISISVNVKRNQQHKSFPHVLSNCNHWHTV